MIRLLTILSLLIGTAQAQSNSLFFSGRSVSVSPVSISTVDTKVNTAATVHSLTGVPAGALLVLTTTSASDGDYVIKHAIVSSSPSLTWTKRVDAQASMSSNAEIWTAKFTAGGTISVTSNWDSDYQSSVCYVVLNAETTLGGASATGLAQTAPSVTLSTTRDNSILFVISSDWNAVDGASRTYRGSATERYYQRSTSAATFYHYTYAAGAIGSKTVGISSPNTMAAGTAVLEIRSSGTSPDTEAPSAFTVSTGTPTSTTVPLTWTASTDNIGVTGYDVYVNSVANGQTLTGTSGTVTGLTASTSYSIYLRAKDAAGNGTNSNTVNPTTAASAGYSLVFSTGYESASDVTTTQGDLNTQSTTIKKDGVGSFRAEVAVNQPPKFGGYRGEMQYSDYDYVSEGAWEYDVYYENWTSVRDGGHSIQWHAQAVAPTPLSLQNLQGTSYLVQNIDGSGTNIYNDLGWMVTPNTWYKFRWEIKWANNATGYIRFYVDGVLKFNYTGKTTHEAVAPYWKVGLNRWIDSGSVIRDATVVYYDNVKIYQKL